MDGNLDLIFQEIKDRLKEQLLSIDQVATKFNFLLAFNSIIIASILQGLFVAKIQQGFSPMLLFSIFLLLFSAFLDLRGLIIQKYRRDPDPKKLYEKYKESDADKTKRVLIQNYIESFDDNTKKLHRINKYFAFSIVFSSVALLLIFIFLSEANIISLWETIIKTIYQK